MLRLLKEAFWLRVPLPLLGALPANALAVAGVGILGFAEPSLWLIGAGLEAAYLFTLATNARFQRLVAARDLGDQRAAAERSRGALLTELPPESRARLQRLEGKVARVGTLLHADPDKDLLAESSLDALSKLAAVHARLLLAERHLHAARHESDPAALARQAAALERDLTIPFGSPALSPTLTESKQATLDILRRRLANAQARDRSLAEVSSDLARIEAQVDLALEEASLHGTRPDAASTAHLNLLDDILSSNAALGASLDREGEVVPDAKLPRSDGVSVSASGRTAPPPLPEGR